uniref:Uncharacterized protein n=1 Tax=Timema shepardi TaxID=629360 RepID=A0A7R9B0C2_TIMSH|nr:unnamed protein product [Timema shepardi]
MGRSRFGYTEVSVGAPTKGHTRLAWFPGDADGEIESKPVITTASADDESRYSTQGARPKKRRAPPPPTPPPALHQAPNTSLTSGDNTSSSGTSNSTPHQNSSDLIQPSTNETEPIVEQTEIDHETLRFLVNRIQTEFNNEEEGIEVEENASQRKTIPFFKCSSAKTCNVERESSGSNESIDDVSFTIEHPTNRSLVTVSGSNGLLEDVSLPIEHPTNRSLVTVSRSNELKDDVSLPIEHPTNRSLVTLSGSNELTDDVSPPIEHQTSRLLTEESGNNELPDDVSLPMDHLTTDSLIEESRNKITFDSSIASSSERENSDDSINNNLSDLTVEESKRKVESKKEFIHSLNIKEGSDIATVVVVSSEKKIPISGERVDERDEIENFSEVKYVSKIPNNNLITSDTSERTTSNRNFELPSQVDSNNCDNIKTNSDNISEDKNNFNEIVCTNTLTQLNKDVSSDITRVTTPNESTETTKKDANVVETNIEEVRNGLVETSMDSQLEFDDGNKSPTKEVPPEIPAKKTNNRFFRSLKTTKKEPLTSSPTPPPRSKPQPTPRIKRLKKLFAS